LPFTIAERIDLINEFVPNPKYIPLEELNTNLKKLIRPGQLSDFNFNKKKCLVPKSNKEIEFYRNIIPTVLKTLVSNPFSISGLNVTCANSDGISLLMRMCNFFCTAPYYLTKAYDNKDQRLAYIASLLISGFQ